MRIAFKISEREVSYARV